MAYGAEWADLLPISWARGRSSAWRLLRYGGAIRGTIAETTCSNLRMMPAPARGLSLWL